MSLRYFPSPDKTPKELIQTLQNGLEYGVAHHLKSFIEDKNFRKWVLRDNYINLGECYNHPELIEEIISSPTDWRS